MASVAGVLHRGAGGIRILLSLFFRVVAERTQRRAASPACDCLFVAPDDPASRVGVDRDDIPSPCGARDQRIDAQAEAPSPAPTTNPAEARLLPQTEGDAPDRTEGPTLSRRRLLGAAAVAIPPMVAAGISVATVVQLSEFKIRYVNIIVPGLPPDLHGLTIAQVTDLHIGKLTRPAWPMRRRCGQCDECGSDRLHW